MDPSCLKTRKSQAIFQFAQGLNCLFLEGLATQHNRIFSHNLCCNYQCPNPMHLSIGYLNACLLVSFNHLCTFFLLRIRLPMSGYTVQLSLGFRVQEAVVIWFTAPIVLKLSSFRDLPIPSSYPLLGLKYPLLGTIYPELRVQGGSWYITCFQYSGHSSENLTPLDPKPLHTQPLNHQTTKYSSPL